MELAGIVDLVIEEAGFSVIAVTEDHQHIRLIADPAGIYLGVVVKSFPRIWTLEISG